MDHESFQPDLDWSQVRETVKLLSVSVVQLESGAKEGDVSVNTLTDSFTSLVNKVQLINQQLAQLDESDARDKAQQYCIETENEIQSSIIAFQFYDRLQQCLNHVAENLKGLSTIVETPDKLYSPFEWKKFQDEIRGRYTMESEKIMFDAILQGHNVEEALKIAEDANKPDDEDDIELF